MRNGMSGRRARNARAVPAVRLARRDHRWAIVLLLPVVLLAYYPAWHGGLLWDDDAHLTRVTLRDGAGLWRIWSDVSATPQYYPVVHTAFWLMFQAWGVETLGYHLVTIVLHAASACLVALFLRRHDVPGAALAATIFALHPVHVESVAWITELKNTLSGFFYLISAQAYSRFDATRDRRAYIAALLAFAAALLSKTVTASLPAVLLVFFWWQRGRLEWRRDVIPTLPFFGLGLAGGLMTAWLERAHVGARGAEFDFSALDRILIAGRAVWFYIGKLLWPHPLVFTYPRWTIDPAVGWQFLFPLAVVAALGWFWAIRRRTRAPLAAALVFVGTLVPALGFFNVYPFRYSFVADHFQYLASLGIIVPFASVLAIGARRLRTGGESIAIVVLGTALGFLTWMQAAEYRDAETLYAATLTKNPESFMAHNNLGARLVQGSDADLPQAIVHLEEAARINPRAAETKTNLGLARERQGRFSEAEALHREAISLHPGLAEAHYNLGNTLAALGRHAEAVTAFDACLGIHPQNAQAQHNKSLSLTALGRVDEALAAVQAAATLEPGNLMIRRSLADAYVRSRRYQDAIAEYRAIMRATPSAEVENNLGLALQHAGQLPEAITTFQSALRESPSSLLIWVNLARAYVAASRPDEGLIAYQGALRFAGPGDAAGIHLEIARLYAGLSRREEAMQHLQTAMRLNPELASQALGVMKK